MVGDAAYILVTDTILPSHSLPDAIVAQVTEVDLGWVYEISRRLVVDVID